MDLPFLTALSPEDLRAQGIGAPWTFGVADRVRFGELDVLGHVNNTVYLRWFENLRIRYFETYGADASSRPKIVLRNVGLDFAAEVKLGDDYILTGRTVELRKTSFTMHYAVFVRGQQTTTGHAVIVCLTPDNLKMPIPDEWRAKFIEMDGAVQA